MDRAKLDEDNKKLSLDLGKFAQDKENWLKESEQFKEMELLKIKQETDNLK